MPAKSHHNRAAARSLQLNNSKGYYLCQSTGWGAYAILIYLMSSGNRRPGYTTILLVWCACGMIGTHLLRTYAKRYPWQTIPQLIRRLAFAGLLIPSAMISAQIAFTDGHNRHGWPIFAHYVQAFILVLLWCALYFGAHEIRKRQVAEMEALRLALVAQVSQFHLLRSQLNPHFLFNCLNSLRELIDEDRERAKQALTHLSELLRYTLHADRVETVSLRDELHAVEDYLSLEKIRFEQRLRLRYEIAPEILSAQVPPMLVQTLAENGLKHGIAKRPAGGELSIVAYRANGNLQIQVTNTGLLDPPNGASAVGLENARERVRLIYGESASLTLSATPNEKVQATVTIPFRQSRRVS
jgi:two-component system sensor histidine kinase AlgZ